MQIIPYAKNAKKHPQKQIDQLAAIVREVGWRQPILVNQQGVIVAGHGRWETYQKNKDLKEPWIIDDAGKTIMGEPASTPLTKEQEMAYRLADNKLAETDVDMGLVIEELKELEALGELAPLTGYDMDLTIEPDEADDEVPDVPEEPRSKLGDLYELGEHRVLCGNSTKLEDVERLMDGKKADMVFTDPPYSSGGSQESGKTGGSIGARGQKTIKSDNLSTRGYRLLMDDVLANVSCCHSVFIFCDWKMWIETFDLSERAGYRVRNMIVWDKMQMGMGMPFRNQHELCLFGSKIAGKIGNGNTPNVLAHKRDREAEHATPKPVNLILDMVGQVESDSLYDPFLGSGSTLIASQKTGRICYGMELDPKYVDVIVQRYVDYVDNPVVKCNGKDVTNLWKKTKSPQKQG
jgi:DNA modification methylase